MRIAISPDENPDQPGSVAADGTTERSVNLSVAVALQVALARCGVDAWFDPSITFEGRVARANQDGTDVLVACAHDVSTPGVRGTTFVFCPGGLEFGRQAAAADAVYAHLAALPGWPARRPNTVENVYECCAFDRDTVYVEYLCMSPEDETLWSQPNYAVRAAEATARGLAATYGFTYVPQGPIVVDQPQPPAGPVPTDAQSHWWAPYVIGADQVVELVNSCTGPVIIPPGGNWYRFNTIIGDTVLGETCQYRLANRIKGVWYLMDESGGPQGQGPMGRLEPEQSYWTEDAGINTTACGGTDPAAVARANGGRWWSI